MLALFALLEVSGFRKGGLLGKFRLEDRIDHVSHISGYAAGLAGALMLRHYDPKWRGLERHSFWNSRFSREEGQTGRDRCLFEYQGRHITIQVMPLI